MRLESIRNRSGLLMVVIGIAMFAFIMMDLMSSQRGSGGQADMSVGEIHGEAINVQEFEALVQEQIELQKVNNPNIDVEQVRTSVWSQMVAERVMAREYDALGLTVGSDELFDMVQGNDPHSSIKQAFTNPETGQFDRARLLQYLKQDIDNDPTGDARQRWMQFEEGVQKERLASKYNNLVNKGVQVSDWEVENAYQMQGEVRAASYISVAFNTIDDSLVTVSDAELRAYMQENEDRFQQEASRSLEYVVFTVTPSEEDDAAALQWATEMQVDFGKTEEDEVFARRFSDNPAAGILTFVTEKDLDPTVASLFTAEVGTVLPPFNFGRGYRVAKLVDRQSRPDSVEARHILATGPDAEAKIDSLKKLIEGGASFAELAEANSEDPGSAANGGELGWFPEGLMVVEFNDVCFTANKGDLTAVNSQFGTHLIEVTAKSRSSQKVKVASIDRMVEPSNETYQKYWAQAGMFAASSTNTASFNASAEEQNVSKRVAEDLTEVGASLPGIENPRALIRWAFQSEVGAVSDVLEFGNKIVVANLVKIKEEGMQDLEDVRAQVETAVKNDKKADLIIEQLAGDNLDVLAADFGVEVQQAEGVIFNNSQVNGLGDEKSFVGATYALDKGEMSGAFAGKNAVFVLRVDEVIAAPQGDQSLVKNQLSSGVQARAQYEVLQSLRDLANVKDSRAKFY